jgi:parallel beta-helix repeat protein
MLNKQRRAPSWAAFLFIVMHLMCASHALPVSAGVAVSTIAITTTSDLVDGDTASIDALESNPGPDLVVSLREAILAAEATTGTTPIEITFQLSPIDSGYDPLSDTWLITLHAAPSALLPPLVRGSLTIDATTQSGTTQPAVIIDGFEVVEDQGASNGFVIQSAENHLRGMALINFYDSAIVLDGPGATDNTVTAMMIGESPRGIAELATYIGVELRDGATQNTIGGAALLDSNRIAASLNAGVLITDNNTQENTVIGNLIGPGLHAETPGNQFGISILGDARHNLISSNVIGGNTYGIYLRGTEHNRIVGNTIGLAADGLQPIPNTQGGVYITGGASQNLVGGINAADRNLIGANGGPGIYIANNGSDNNQIQGNYIGLSSNGLTPRGNLRQGVLIAFDAADNLIGGATASAGNVIVYNGMGGVRIDADDNQVLQNLIGVAPDRSTPLGNQLNGVRIAGQNNQISLNTISNNQLAGVLAGGSANQIDQNLIRQNALSGVCVTGSGNSLTENEIIENGGSAISSSECLITSGVYITGTGTLLHQNTILDNHGPGVVISQGDSNTLRTNSISGNDEEGILLSDGGNAAIAAPQIMSVSAVAVQGVACPGCLVEIFSDSGGQGREALSSSIADPSGAFSCPLPALPLRGYLTATLTDASGNTSSFSLPAGIPPPRVTYDIGLPLVSTP